MQNFAMEACMDSRIARLLAGLAAGGLTVFLIDRFVWPGTLSGGLVGVVTAVVVLSLTTHKA